MNVCPIADSSQVTEARRAAVAIAQEIGFSDEDRGRVAIVVTELCTNLLKHAVKGELAFGVSDTTAAGCIEIVALDQGPGMRDVDLCLEDGFSTAGSRGTGLGAIRRQATTFDAFSIAGHGSVIHARICKAKTRYVPRERTPWAGILRAMPGEDACGDAIAVREASGTFVALMADGLGHGAFAAQASADATRIFASSESLDADTLAESIHLGLRSTRGAAIAVASVQHAPRVATYSGIGNIASVLIDDRTARRMVSHNGTAGLVARRIHGFQYPYASGALLVMHTDGLASAWSMDRYPGLAERSPMLIAGVLYRDFARARDDAGVLVARLGL